MHDPLTVAGIPFVHRAVHPVEAPTYIISTWRGSRDVDSPLAVLHQLGPTSPDGLQLLFTTPLPHGDYYRDAAQNVAVRFPESRSGAMHPHLLLTRRQGHEYEIRYERPQDVARLQREWHRTLLTIALPFRARGLVVHAAGLVLPNGMGIVCPGVSGVGKSTLAKALLALGGETRVLSDDRVAVTDEAGKLWVWGTPWHSSARASAPMDAPCAAIVLIRHGAGATLRAVSARHATQALLRALGIPFWDRAACEFALSFADRMLTEIPIFEFEYTPSSEAARALVASLTTEVTIPAGGLNGALCAFE